MPDRQRLQAYEATLEHDGGEVVGRRHRPYRRGIRIRVQSETPWGAGERRAKWWQNPRHEKRAAVSFDTAARPRESESAGASFLDQPCSAMLMLRASLRVSFT